MAARATNTDLAHGPLDGLPQPEPIINLAGMAPWPVRKAYRIPGPESGDPDVWLPLPSEFSSVCVSPLANDMLHRIFWTNPPGSPDAGAWWNTYDRIKAGNSGTDAHWSMGFLPPDSSAGAAPVVTVSGGTLPAMTGYGATIVDAGTGYIPGQQLSVFGGTLAEGGQPMVVSIAHTFATSARSHFGTAGTGGTDGPVTLTGTTGVGVLTQVRGIISSGTLYSVDGIADPGAYTTNPTNVDIEPVAGGGLTGAAITLTMGVRDVAMVNAGSYTVLPPNPVQTRVVGGGPGQLCLLDVTWQSTGAPPLEERSYCYTFIDQYGTESSPSAPSLVVAGPSNGVWHVTNLPRIAPVAPTGRYYPPPVKTRLYRTLVAATAGAQFYFVVDLPFGTTSYDDRIPNTTVVNNNILQSVSFAPPVDGLDGLLSMAGGMMVAFTENTVHFCEPNRPNAWPAGYDQSLLYQIVAMGVWQQQLIVLTSGFPSAGVGNRPDQFTFAQIQTAEPCISRGSLVTDLAGIYYSSPNGLVAINYYGAQNQTLSNLTREIWLKRFHGDSLVAARHRAQYLAVNGTGMGFVIDYTEQRLGICSLSPFVGIVSVWNDVYTGDTYMVGDQTVYRWDSMETPVLTYRWRSREFYFPAPVSLGACQISLDPDVSLPKPKDAIPPPTDGMSTLNLPNGVNAIFRIFAGPSQQLVHEEWLQQPRCIFRLPSGRKAFNWQFEIIARVAVHSVELASTMRELKGV
jgi:hypothetical protein